MWISTKASLDVFEESKDSLCKEFLISPIFTECKDYFWAKLCDKLDQRLPIVLC